MRPRGRLVFRYGACAVARKGSRGGSASHHAARSRSRSGSSLWQGGAMDSAAPLWRRTNYAGLGTAYPASTAAVVGCANGEYLTGASSHSPKRETSRFAIKRQPERPTFRRKLTPIAAFVNTIRQRLWPPAADMDYIKDGWFMEKCTLWPGQAMSLKVNEVLYNKKSKYQDVMVFKRSVTLL